MIAPAKIQVRFSDLDVLGHVNNSVYFSYFEMTRVHYFQELLGKQWDWKKFGVVLVRNEIDYKRSVLLYDEPEIQMFTEFVASKSFGLRYELKVNGEVYAMGKSVMVCFDATTQLTIPVPDTMRTSLEELILRL
jgi:acyl-CoA thioester hydrolase